MAIRTYDILLDSYNAMIPEPIVGRQGDKNGAVTLHVTVTDRGTAVDLSGQTINLMAETAKGTAIIADNGGVTVTNAIGGKFDYAIPNALWSEAGKITKAYFSLNDTNGQQTTYDLIFIVKKAIDISQKEADDYITIVDGTLRNLQAKIDNVDVDTILLYAKLTNNSVIKNSNFLTEKVDPWSPNTSSSALSIFELNNENWLRVKSTDSSSSTGAFVTLDTNFGTQHLLGLLRKFKFKIRCDNGGEFELHLVYRDSSKNIIAEQSLKTFKVIPWRLSEITAVNVDAKNASQASTIDVVIRSTGSSPVDFAITDIKLTELPAIIDNDLLDINGDYHNTIKNSNFWNGTVYPWLPNSSTSNLSVISLNGKKWLRIVDTSTGISSGAYTNIASTIYDNHVSAVPQDVSLTARCDNGGIFVLKAFMKDVNGSVVSEVSNPFKITPWREAKANILIPGGQPSSVVSMDIIVQSLNPAPVDFDITDIHMAEHATTEPNKDNLLQNASLSDDTVSPFTPNTDHSKLSIMNYNGRRWLQVLSDSDGSPSIGVNYVIDYDKQKQLGLINLRSFNQKFAFSINDLAGHDYLIEALDQDSNGKQLSLRTLQRISITPFANHRITVTVPQVSDTNVAKTIIIVRCVQSTNVSFMLTDFIWNDEVQMAPDDGKALIIPPKIPMVEGHETRVFLDNIFHNGDYYKAEKMIIPGTTDAIYAGGYHVTPTAASTNNTQYVQYYRGQYPALMAPLNFVKVPADAGSGKNVKVMLLGESTTEMTGLVNGFYDLTDADVLNVTGIGTRGTAPRLHEGRSGWTTENYMHDATALEITNSFYNPTSKQFDFAYYIGNNKLATPDYVFIDMGINDSWQEIPLKITLSNYQFMINSIRWLNPNAKIIIGLTNLPEKFKNMWDFNFGLKDKILKLINALITTYGNRESEGYFLNPIYLNVDPYWDMQYEERVISPDGNQKEFVGTNGAHPSDAGFKRCADVLYATLKYAVSI